MRTWILGNVSPEMPTTERKFDMIEEDPRGKINSPESAQTNSGPNQNTFWEVRLMPKITPGATDNPSDELRKHAIGYLELTREQGEAFIRNRSYYADLAKRYGLTNQEIGDVLGITEARVRQLVTGS